MWHYVNETNYIEERDVIVPKRVDEQALISGVVPREVLERGQRKRSQHGSRLPRARAKSTQLMTVMGRWDRSEMS